MTIDVEGRKDATEETSLLAPPTTTSSTDQDVTISAANKVNWEADDRPLPLAQIMLLCYARMIEPVAFFGIFPFINQMVQANGHVAEADIGFYSGLIESLFSLTQMLVMIFWGRMSDKFGRKPVLVVSLFGLAFTTTIFGFATTIWQMIVFRCFAGVFAGTIVTVRTMITELSTSKTQARAFSYFAFAGNLGIFLGPLIGGCLADAATQYPRFFAHNKFLNAYPYALPTIVTGLIGGSGAILGLLFIKETRPPVLPSATSKRQDQSTLMSLLRTPGIPMVLYLTGHVMLLAFAFTAIIPLFFYTTPALGGYGFSSLQISIFMGLIGFCQAIWLLLIFPPLQKRIGTGGILKLCGTCYPLFLLGFPLLNLMLRLGGDDKAVRIAFFVLLTIALAVGLGICMSFTAVQLALNNVAPNMETLGTLNGLALTLISGIRAATPWLFTSIFAVGARTQFLYGYLVWLVLVLVALGLTWAVRYLPEKAGGDGSAHQNKAASTEDGGGRSEEEGS